MQYHPDSSPSKQDQEMFILVNRAYGVLSKPSSKQKYDDWLASGGHTRKRKDFFSPSEDEDTKDFGLESPWPGQLSQDHYLHPTFYKEGSKLRFEPRNHLNLYKGFPRTFFSTLIKCLFLKSF